jgi:transcriptional regulator with XRE-family HTH domain
MTDTAKLKQAIADSGLKKSHIAQQMGITRQSLDRYINNKAEFRASHIETLSTILKLVPEQRMAIFFAPSGG